MEPHEEDEVEDAKEFEEVFTVEDLIAEDDIFEEIVAEGFKADMDREASTVHRRRRQSGPRRYIPRNREQGHDDLVANYFSANLLIIFPQILSTPMTCSVGDLG